jgi:hypothetical protein
LAVAAEPCWLRRRSSRLAVLLIVVEARDEVDRGVAELVELAAKRSGMDAAGRTTRDVAIYPLVAMPGDEVDT